MRSELAGVSVVLTRDDPRLATLLAERGARVVTLPCVWTEPLDRVSLRHALAGIGANDALVLTSAAGVDAVAAAVELRELPCRVAVVGPATAARLRARGREPDQVASAPSGAALARELVLPEGEAVLARSDLAPDDLPAILRARGARVRELIAYRTHAEARGDVGAAREALASDRAACVVASPSALAGLVAAVGPECVRHALVVAIGPTTAAAVTRELAAAPLVAVAPEAQAVADVLEEGLRVAAG